MREKVQIDAQETWYKCILIRKEKEQSTKKKKKTKRLHWYKKEGQCCQFYITLLNEFSENSEEKHPYLNRPEVRPKRRCVICGWNYCLVLH